MTTTTSTTPTAAPAPAPPRGPHRVRRPAGWWPFIIPALVLVIAFFAVPFLLNLRFAFTDWSGYSDVIAFNGLDNFLGLIDQDMLWQAIKVALLYAVMAMLIQNVFSLSMALALQRPNRTNGFCRSCFLLPVLVA